MLIGKDNRTKFARQVVYVHYQRGVGLHYDGFDDIRVAIEIAPRLSETKQKLREKDLFEPLVEHWWNFKSVSVARSADAELSQRAMRSMMTSRWRLCADLETELKTLLNKVKVATRIKDFERATDTCIRGGPHNKGHQSELWNS